MTASSSTGVFATLGVPGVVLLVLVAIVTGYTAARPFRPHATWFTDLAKLRAKAHHHRPPRVRHRPAPLPMPGGIWPVCTVGPRMLRWPLNSTRWVCARGWHTIAHRRGLPYTVARVAWYPSTALGLLAALIQALLLMVLITAPAAVLLFTFDTLTVLRGGTPPGHRISPVKARAITQRQEAQRAQRLAQVRSDVRAIAKVAA